MWYTSVEDIFVKALDSRNVSDIGKNKNMLSFLYDVYVKYGNGIDR